MGEPTLERFEAWYRDVVAAFSRGDLDRAWADFGDDVEWHLSAAMPDTQVLVGRDQVRAYYQGIADVLPGFAAEPQEFRQVAPGVFVIKLLLTGSGRVSGAGVERVTHHVFETRDGRPVRVRVFDEPQEALAAAEEAAGERA